MKNFLNFVHYKKFVGHPFNDSAPEMTLKRIKIRFNASSLSKIRSYEFLVNMPTLLHGGVQKSRCNVTNAGKIHSLKDNSALHSNELSKAKFTWV